MTSHTQIVGLFGFFIIVVSSSVGSPLGNMTTVTVPTFNVTQSLLPLVERSGRTVIGEKVREHNIRDEHFGFEKGGIDTKRREEEHVNPGGPIREEIQNDKLRQQLSYDKGVINTLRKEDDHGGNKAVGIGEAVAPAGGVGIGIGIGVAKSRSLP